jgi:predicted DNA-binding protein (MmcQ/YjbR family)
VDAAVLEKLRKICLALPGAEEKFTWGHPNFRVKNKIFCSIGDYKDAWAISVKVGKAIQGVFLEDPRFFKTPYVGQHGWVSLRISGKLNWKEIQGLVEESYRQIRGKA